MIIVVVRISNLLFGFEISNIEKIVEQKQDVIQIPLVPSFIQGLMNFQGRVITVINLAKLFKLDSSNKKNLVLISNNAKNLGFMVEEILGFKSIDEYLTEKIEPSEVVVDGHKFKSYILYGIFNVPVSFLNFSDIEKFILNPDNWSSLDECKSFNM